MTCFFYVVVLLSSCSRNYHYPELLVRIDSLCMSHPDSALMALQSIKDTISAFDDDAKWYYKLLCVKAADKEFILPKSDNEILSIVNHYENGGDPHLLPEAYYYAGSVYRDLNDAPQSLDYFNKMLNLKLDDSYLHLKSNAYNQSAIIFERQGLYQNAVNYYWESFRIDSILNDSTNMICNLKDLGYVYQRKNTDDSCLVFYDKAIRLAEKMRREDLRRNVYFQSSVHYLRKGDYENAKKRAMPLLYHIEPSDTFILFSTLSKIYLSTDNLDSARYFSNLILNGGTVYNKQTASRNLAKISFMEGKYDDGYRYLDLFYTYTDSVEKIKAVESVAQMSAMYDYKLREDENILLKEKEARHVMMIRIGVAILIILILIVIIFFLHYNYKRKLREGKIKQLEKELFEQSEEFIRQNEQRINELEHELEEARTTFEAERIEMEKSFLEQTNELAQMRISQKEAELYNIRQTDAYKLISSRLETNGFLSNDDFKNVDQEISSLLPDFKKRLFDICRISNHEYKICLLIRMGLTVREIGIMLCCSDSAVSKARVRMHEKFFGNKGSAKDFDKFVKTL